MRIVSGCVLVMLFASMGWLPCALAQSLESTIKMSPTPELDARGRAMVAHHQKVRGEYRERARRELLAEAKSEAGIFEMAAERLRRSGADIFQVQRVEVTGWFSYSPDEVERRYRRYFNQRIALSHAAQPPAYSGPVARAWSQSRNYALDKLQDVLAETRHDRKGILSARAMEQLQPVSNVTIREIWAHSWATDAIYNGILYGVVLPPKRLVLLGLPTRNLAKWESLAHATGTEVFIYGFDQDFVTRRYPIDIPGAGTIYFSADDFPGALTPDPEKLTSTWNAWVIENASRKRPNARPGTVSTLWNVPDQLLNSHLRDRYYNYLIDTLSWAVPVSALADQQHRLIMQEADRLENEHTDLLLAKSPPPPFQDPGLAVVQAQRAPVVAAVHAVDPTSIPCLNSTVEKACESAQGLDRLPSICGAGTLLQASPAALKAAAERYRGNACAAELAEIMIRQRGFPASYGFYSVDILNQHVQTIRRLRTASQSPIQSASNGSVAATSPACREACSNEPNCGPITYERKCVSGFCFDAPRQHCSSRRVCQQVCR